MSQTAKIDWTELTRRLAADETTHATLPELNPARRQAILRERARAASTVVAAEDDSPTLEAVEFTLLHETYGLEATHVREVCLLERYVPLPAAPAFVLGVTQLRGRMLTIFNLKPFFELPDRGLTNLNRVLVLRAGPLEFGLLADEVSGALRRIPLAALRPPPPTFDGPRLQFTRGITAAPLILLDALRLLHDPRFAPTES